MVFSDEARTVADGELQCRRLLARWHTECCPRPDRSWLKTGSSQSTGQGYC